MQGQNSNVYHDLNGVSGFTATAAQDLPHGIAPPVMLQICICLLVPTPWSGLDQEQAT
jgi:hypothetical protein